MSTDLPETPDTENPDAEAEFIEDGVLYDDEVTPEYGILGFTLRELLIVGVWLVAFVVSFFPAVGDTSIWGSGIQWLVPIGLPTAAVFLVVLRRFSPDGIRRVGSLGIDQFASVVFSFAALTWIGLIWNAVESGVELGVWLLGWSGIVQLLASLALVALTVFAPIIPGLREDFQGRLVTLAHRSANPVRPVVPRPRPEVAAQPVPEPSTPVVLDEELSGQHTTDEIARSDIAGQVPLAAHASGGGTGTAEATADETYTPSYSRRSRGREEIVSDTDSIVALVTPESTSAEASSEDDSAAAEHAAEVDLDATNPRRAAADPQPFWILAATEREVHDERGDVLFTIGPAAWALVIEDRGGAYVVRHDDGRIGYLHDISDITKG